MSTAKTPGGARRVKPAAKKPATDRKTRSPKKVAAPRKPAKGPKPDPFRDFVVDQLREVQGVVARSMFGGHGLYRGEAFFGVIYEGRLYFKTDAQSEVAYRERGMDFFHPKPHIYLKHHFEVPADVLEDSEQLAVWARRALAVKS
ncbi:MAG: TfoX/Sxy family protein [Chloroflexi bacterium]|nr:TfoX/Sxy family protein [Chloroflexota bacterium]